MSEDPENLSNAEEQDEEFPEVKEDIKVWQIYRLQHKKQRYSKGPQSVLDFKVKLN